MTIWFMTTNRGKVEEARQYFANYGIEVKQFEFEATELNDKEGREAIYLKLRGVEYVRQSLKIMVDNASIEKKVK